MAATKLRHVIFRCGYANSVDGKTGIDRDAMAMPWTSLQLAGDGAGWPELPIARMWADARVERICGASEIHKEVIARSR